MYRNLFTILYCLGALAFACLLVSSATLLDAAENGDIRDIAERFVRQVGERDTNAILQSYPMTDEFRAAVPNADKVIGWAREIDRIFGRLGNVVDSEIVEHQNLGLRSVELYYQGTKRPARLRVTFSGTTIAGFHYHVWEEGYATREPTRGKLPGIFIIWGFILIPMLIISLFLLNGKGAFLIAGYNTMSKEEQAKYDEKAVCRCTGGFLLAMTFVLLLVPIGIHTETIWLSLCVIPISAFATIGLLIYSNTGDRFLKQDVEKEKREESFLDRTLYSRSVQNYIGWLGAIVVFGGLVLAFFTPVLLFTGEQDPTVEIIDSSIKISGRYGLKIDFSEITDISLMEKTISSIGLTRSTFGYGTSTTQKGYFRSDMYGSVLLFTRTKSLPTIHIARDDKADVFLNFSNNEATRTLYNDMKTAFAK